MSREEVFRMITKEMTITEVIEKYPATIRVLQKSGLGCIGCMMAASETIGEGIAAHGLDVDKIMAEMNKVAEE